MTIANELLFLALRNAGVSGVGQTPRAEDVNDSFRIMNAFINHMNLQRIVVANPNTLPTFTDLVHDVPYWTPYEHMLLTNMAVRLRQVYNLQANPADIQIALEALQTFQAINQQQFAPLHPGLVNTVQQLIFMALRMAGRITDTQSVSDSSKDVNDAFALFVMMLAQWQKKRWLVYVEQEVSLQSTGAQSYTIGPGAQFDCSRPANIKAAYARILGGTPPNLVDIPLEIIPAREDYAAITVKTLSTMPYAVWYESAYPIGNLWFWPVPPSAMYGLYVTVQSPLPTYVAVTDTLALPPEYIEPLAVSLAVRIVNASGQPLPPQLALQGQAALATLRQANIQIPVLAIPAPLGRIRPDLSLVGPGFGRAFVLDQGAVLG